MSAVYIEMNIVPCVFSIPVMVHCGMIIRINLPDPVGGSVPKQAWNFTEVECIHFRPSIPRRQDANVNGEEALVARMSL